jgi:D-glycero-D-manno-heptose 1,7-bisphosphate phosphatase
VSKPAVFLDRDGVLNIEVGYVHQLEDLQLIPGAAKAVRTLNDLGFFCCVVSNQSGPARSYYPKSHVDDLHRRLVELLEQEGSARLDAIYYCPYLSPAAGGTNPDFSAWSSWRKPNTGMLVAAAWEHDLDLCQSFMIGDKATDIDMAHNAGLTGILVKTGYGESVLSGNYQHSTKPDYSSSDLLDAVDWIKKKTHLRPQKKSRQDRI